MARGIKHAGSFNFDGAVADVQDVVPFAANITILSAAADVINPHRNLNAIVNRAGVDAMTLGAPTSGLDDGLIIAVYSDSTNAHTITAPSAIFANGAALATVITFKAFRGSGVILRAFNGVWQVIVSNVTTIA